MIIMDLNQVLLSNLMMSIKKNSEISEGLIRHMALNSIRHNLVKFKSDFGELIIACDDQNYWRKSKYPYYKASRKKSRDSSPLDWDEIFRILNSIREELKAYFPYRVIQIQHAEADDVIASLVSFFGRDFGGEKILILSGDKDFQQLQKYSNVQQYDPTRKKWIRCTSPASFLYEHIMRGDAGDGIPNILSDDDVFVVSGKRQSPLQSKKVDEWLSLLNSGVEPKNIFDENQYRNWIRNQSLIDLSLVPNDIVTEVLSSYHEQNNKERKHLFNYFIKYRLKNLTECINEF